MLLPSDVARLVLGYLQEEGLSATTQAFIQESPNLKEYAEHTMGDGTLPACVFSVFGKGLTTILNEYMAAKAKETCHEVPAMMTSLWKKLDFTLKQIKSLQSSPAMSASQRARSRAGLENLARQQVLTVTSASSLVCSSETSLISSQALSSPSMLSHPAPGSHNSPQIRAPPGTATSQQFHDISRSLSIQRESPIQILVSEQRPNPGPMSPGRRKWDTPRKRSGALGGSSGASKHSTPASNVTAEPQLEEVVDENFPQLVIQNARDKILGDRSLQEKLAENINKILANEPTPQTPKAPSSSIEDDQSIDEILGLQGEIHMSEDAIHDILKQTESDPAFQALFDLFDYNKTRTDGEPGTMEMDNKTGESDNAGSPPSSVGQLQSSNPGAALQETTDLTAGMEKNKAIQDRKTRKSNPLLKKSVLGSSSRSSQIENSTAKLFITLEEPPGENRKEKASLFNNSVDASPMDIDGTLNTSAILDSTPTLRELECVTKVNSPTTMSLIDSTADLLSRASSTAEPVINVDNQKESKEEQGSQVQPAASLLSSQSEEPVFLAPAPVKLSGNPSLPSVAISGGTIQSQMNLPVTSQSSRSLFSSAGATVSPPLSSCLSTSHTSPLDSSTLTSTTSSISGMLDAAQSSSVTSNFNTPMKDVTDSSNVVSLKIIISDNPDEDPSSDTALNQAISSISTEKLPTIYLSSPAKSPRDPGTPRGTKLDETALAVHGLQSSEALANSPCGAGTLVPFHQLTATTQTQRGNSPCRAGALVPFHQLTSTTQMQQAKSPNRAGAQVPFHQLTATQTQMANSTSRAGALVPSHPLPTTTQTQQSYIIQLALDTANPVLQAASTSYFLMTEPLTADPSGRPVQVPAGSSKLPLLRQNNPYSVSAATPKQSLVPGSPLILPSPVKPMMLPVSVVGQNVPGNVQMVSNPTITLDPKLSMVAAKQSTTGGTMHSEATQNAFQQHEPKNSSSSHKRILCFEPSTKIQPATSKPATAASSSVNTSTSKGVTQTKKGRSQTTPCTRPAILRGNRHKRKVEDLRCSSDSNAPGNLVKSVSPQQQSHVRKNSGKQDANILNQKPQIARGSSDVSQREFVKSSEPETTLKSASGKHSHNENAVIGAPPMDSGSSELSSSHSLLKSTSSKDKVESSRKEPAQEQAGKNTHTQDKPNVMADKENKVMAGSQEQQQQSCHTPFSSAPADLAPSAVTQSSQSTAAKIPTKTSSLAIQAVEMLQNIQGLNSPPRPVKRLTVGLNSPDVTGARIPGAVGNQEESRKSPRTPLQQKKGKDSEGTPKNLLPHNTPEIPTCSPASEAGSENSINMAAHTLMILSRAAIARTGSPLKDSLRQGAGETSPAGLKNSKKRKQPPATASPPVKKSSKQSPIKKKTQQRKTLINCFPHDLDVDKFLSSLHYDE
ncbi:protein NPAT isoform X2 [Hippocampus comes]|uniref:protein NPAT isoform X2 n=1 Tax=Hippocampus comes TaxID=109280 RepID=UPI00094F15C0|nr:PREDICTED: protein NPAT isoform X2 [Hippocampus comes]